MEQPFNRTRLSSRGAMKATLVAAVGRAVLLTFCFFAGRAEFRQTRLGKMMKHRIIKPGGRSACGPLPSFCASSFCRSSSRCVGLRVSRAGFSVVPHESSGLANYVRHGKLVGQAKTDVARDSAQRAVSTMLGGTRSLSGQRNSGTTSSPLSSPPLRTKVVVPSRR